MQHRKLFAARLEAGGRRRVVRGDEIDGALANAAQQRALVGGGADGRRALVLRRACTIETADM